MHPNPIFRKLGERQNLAYAQQRSFGTLLLNGDPFPLLAHIPFYVDSSGQFAELHLVRSNPIVRSVEGDAPATISVLGPDGYISPDWYGADDQVPTWNYVAVHLQGKLKRLDDSELVGVLDRLSEHMEMRLKPKPVWHRRKMDGATFDKMARTIVPFRFDIRETLGTWKLSQNKPDEARLSAAKYLGDAGFGLQTNELSELMRDPPKS